jgi:cystathionine beta-lyase family protein involved in aluminum resistance
MIGTIIALTGSNLHCFVMAQNPGCVNLLQVMADIMGADAALVRIQFMSGTFVAATCSITVFLLQTPGKELWFL